ncbi:CatB-related O-acetyltransferase [Halobacillus litoralis]|uniref:CatB-related O-acetyltransferase n=1 Tax=Halobacillus litoralis TaxID=45668 RepID=UPI001CD58E1C|nr:CatB-related O-acetyltransferase [Halobacillus litoralis]MCA0970934.1 CatB-related O-acetyltransferase [Halobacillus litoralis]
MLKIIKRITPNIIQNSIKIKTLQKRYKHTTIESHLIGKGVKIGEGSNINKGVLLRRGVSIGNYTYVNSNTKIFSADIGNFCSISYSSIIGPADHPIKYISTSPKLYGKNNIFKESTTWKNDYHSPPVIGHDVLIGANVVILQGVKIGNGAIIAAGAVVTKDVSPFAIVGGTPAKLIKYRFDESEIAYIESLKWWNLPLDQLKKQKALFINGSQWNSK